MLYAIGLLVWVLFSLVFMGAFCLLCAILFMLIPNAYTHQMMWVFYVSWVQMLGWWVKKLVPNIIEKHKDAFPENEPFIVVANHYSWIDIVILYATVYTKTTPFVFVMKRDLIKLPLIGVICWGLGHPLIYRGRARRKNLMILQDAGKRALRYRYGVMIFPEGTRYTKAKGKPNSYNNLLTPRTIGFEKVLESMGEKVKVIDVTLHYSTSDHTILDFLRGKIGQVVVSSQCEVVDRESAEKWLLETWAKKDQQLQSMPLAPSDTD